ncbi:O-antigen polymerase [Geodermatophilus sp. SYSU D00804]
MALLSAGATLGYPAFTRVDDVVFWTLVVIALWWFVLGLLIISKPADLTEPIHWINGTYLVLFGLHPLAFYLQGQVYRPYHGNYDISQTYTAAIAVGAISFMAVNVAYFLGLSRRRRDVSERRDSEDERGHDETPSYRRLRALRNWAWALLSLGLAGVASNVAAGLGSGNANGDFGAGRTAYVYQLPLLLVPTALVFLVLFAYARSRADLWMGLLVVLGYSSYVLAQGARTSLLLALVPPAVFIVVLRRVRFPRLAVVGVLALAILAFSALRDVNSPDSSLTKSLSDALAGPDQLLIQTFTGDDTEMVDALALEMTIVPEFRGLQPGIMLYSTAGAPIPRLLWAGKPETADVVLNSFLFDRGVNEASVAYSIVGEEYYDSGIAGVIAYGAVFGFSFARLTQWRRRHPSSPFSAALYAVAVAMVPIVIRGILAYSLAIAAFVAVPLVIAHRIVNPRSSDADVVGRGR